MPNSLNIYQETFLISVNGSPVISVAKWEQVNFRNLCFAVSLKGWDASSRANENMLDVYKPRTNGQDFEIIFHDNSSFLKITVRKIIHCSFDIADEPPIKTFNDWHKSLLEKSFP